MDLDAEGLKLERYYPPNQGMCSKWNTSPLSTLLYISPGTKSRFPRDVIRAIYRRRSVMEGLYLGIAVTSLNALVAMGLVIAFM